MVRNHHHLDARHPNAKDIESNAGAILLDDAHGEERPTNSTARRADAIQRQREIRAISLDRPSNPNHLPVTCITRDSRRVNPSLGIAKRAEWAKVGVGGRLSRDRLRAIDSRNF